MKNSRIILFSVLLSLLLSSTAGFTYSRDTHERLNEEALKGSIVDSYLKNNLAFSDGIDEIINKKRVWKRIMDGGKTEDESFRYKNHFHNPLEEDWNEAGLSDVFSGDSSIIWAQDINQKWSWKNARNYYYLALTSATKEERDQNFANLFRALGQVMHLIEDSSVPTHSRNDTHLLYNYEKYLKNLQESNEALFNSFLENPELFNEEILDRTPNSLAPIPIARIVDTDKYTGGNPGVGTGNAIGLSEYANINFLSKDTMFTSDFPHPAKSDVELRTYNGKLYLRKKTDAGGALVEYLAVTRWKYWYRLKDFPAPINCKLPVGLDDKCYEDYARFLLPRAVGYSAGLLNYFFGGKLEVSISTRCYPDTAEYHLDVTNDSDENMIEGTLTFLYEDKDGKYFPIRDASGEPIIIEDVNINAHQRLPWGTIRFVKPQGAVFNYILVFKGKLGQEENAVVGKVWNILEDNCVCSMLPDGTYTRGGWFNELYVGYHTEAGQPTVEYRVYYTYPEGYNSLSVWCPWEYGAPDTANIEIYEVDPESFDIKTVTWNTQPPLGRLIGVKDFTKPNVTLDHNPDYPSGWHIINITGTRGICLKSIHVGERGSWAEFWSLRTGSYMFEEGRQAPHLGYPTADWENLRWIWHYGPWPPEE